MTEKNSNQHVEEPVISLFTAIFVYWSWGILIVIGHIRDFFARIFIGQAKDQHGYAPIVSDFEDFYTRRAYGRIHDCWNRPIASHASSHIKVIERARVSSFFPGYTADMVETGRKTECLNLGSYNYLGFGDANSPTRDDVLESLKKYSVATCSNRFDLGSTTIHVETEKLVARFIGKEAAMIFGMGFGTNSTGIPALLGPGSLIISDSNNHASIVIGSRSSGAKIAVFKHNDVQDLEKVIRKAIVEGQPKTHRPWKRILIIVEGIYSMEGELCPLPEIIELKKKYKCLLYVDEAHSIGAMGAHGRGVCEHFGVNPADVDILMGTFTKSFGAVGGYIAGDLNLIDFLRNSSMGSVYSASISPPACQQIISSLTMILGEDGTDLGKKKLIAIRDNANFFRNKLREHGFHILGHDGSPVVPMMIYLPSTIAAFSRECLKYGIASVVVGFPATPVLLSRARFCISAAHTREELEEAVEKIKTIGDALRLRFESCYF